MISELLMKYLCITSMVELKLDSRKIHCLTLALVYSELKLYERYYHLQIEK